MVWMGWDGWGMRRGKQFTWMEEKDKLYARGGADVYGYGGEFGDGIGVVGMGEGVGLGT